MGIDSQLQPELEKFIVRAKAATYIGDGIESPPCRLGAKDLQFKEGAWAYHDSYFGGSDFIGEEVVYYQDTPVWGMNYFGRLLRPDCMTAAEVGKMLKKSLSRMYQEGRFLGLFEHTEGAVRYLDTNHGDVTWFEGIEYVYQGDILVYSLVYHGGLVRP